MTELGEKLKAARREKGLSLDDLQQITKIQKRYLVAIEEGNYSMMPGEFYARAFIKQYAEAVDLDSRTLFDEFEGEVPSSQQEVVNQEQSRAQKKNAPLTTHSVSGGSQTTRNRFFDILPKILIVLFIVFILFIIWYFVFARGGSSDNSVKTSNDNPTVKVQDDTNSSSNDKKQSNKDSADKSSSKDSADDNSKKDKQNKKEAEDKDKKVAITKGETSGKTTTYTVTNTDKLALEITASGGSSWVGVSTEAGSSIYTKTLTDGQSSGNIDVADNKVISIVVGNAPATVIKVNGEKLELAPNLVKQILTIKLEATADNDSDSSQ